MANETGNHRCVVCNAYGTRSPDNGKTWYCWEHDRDNPRPHDIDNTGDCLPDCWCKKK